MKDVFLPAGTLADLCSVCRASRVVLLASFSADQAQALLSKRFLQCRGSAVALWEPLPTTHGIYIW